jgi:tetratricopeptide (TPR) repeat protein
VFMLFPVSAQPPTPNPKPSVDDQPAPGSRNLAAQHEKRAKHLDEQIDRALKGDRWEPAITAAEELLALRTQTEGATYFKTVSAQWLVTPLRRVAAMPKVDRFAYLSAESMNAQGESLAAQGKYALAQALYENALETHRRLATDDYPITAHFYENLALNLHRPKGATLRPSHSSRRR